MIPIVISTLATVPRDLQSGLEELEIEGRAKIIQTPALLRWNRVLYSYGAQHMAEQKQDNQLDHTYSSSVRIRDVALKTCQRRWTIGRSGKRGSGISVLAARHENDDDDWEEYRGSGETPCLSDSSERQSANTGVKNSQRVWRRAFSGNWRYRAII